MISGGKSAASNPLADAGCNLGYFYVVDRVELVCRVSYILAIHDSA